MTRLITVGKATSPHGVKGWVKVKPLTHDPGRFEELESVDIARPGDESGRRFIIEDVKYQAKNILLKFRGVDSREDADALRNTALRIPESEVLPIDEDDTYYHYQLEGMDVTDSGGEPVGRLVSVMNAGSNDIYVIAGHDGKIEYYLPALKSCVLSVDVERKKMVIDRNWLT